MKAVGIILLTFGGFSALVTIFSYLQFLSTNYFASHYTTCYGCVSKLEMLPNVSELAFALCLGFVFSGTLAFKSYHRQQQLEQERRP